MSTPGAGAGAGEGRRAPRYGMVVDLNRCVGCQTCTIACKHHNDTPPGVQWRRVLDVEQGEYPDVQRLFLVTGCQHCADPPCVPVCPTGATRQRADGLVTMDYDTCIGCGYCAVACPYQARTIAHEHGWYFGAPTRQESHVQHEERVGVATKCTFCVDKVDAAAEAGAVPGLDLEYTPACVSSCIAEALHFGDFADPGSNVSRLAEENANFQMHAELGTDPQVRYLYEVPATTPGRGPDGNAPGDAAGEGASSPAAGRGVDPDDPLTGARQTFWDARAAMNFILGGMGSGLAVAAFAGWAAGWVRAEALPGLFAAAAALMAAGLLFVFAEIGRKARFLYVLRRPQSSWMTRETYAVAVFYPAVLAGWLWPSPALHALGAAAAAAFLYCQGRILHAGKGIPAWRLPHVPWMLVASGLFEGVALLALAAALFGVGAGAEGAGAVGLAAVPAGFAAAGVLLAAVNAALWSAYRRAAAAGGAGPLALRALDRSAGPLHWLGHLAPAAAFALAAAPVLAAAPAAAALAALAGGVFALAGGALWKYTLVTRACYQQGFALPRVPQRGSGARAAPVRLDPA